MRGSRTLRCRAAPHPSPLPAREGRGEGNAPASTPAGRGTTRRSSARRADAGHAPRRDRRWSSSRTRPSWWSRAGAWRCRRATTSSCAAPTPRKREVLGKTADPVLLEVFNNLFMSIAEQMGEALRNTAQSVNIKERLDFSCAVFDAKGELVANAPHMPVHLGSMDRSVETVIRAQRGQAAAGRRLHAERALQRRHAPARHHRHHAGVLRVSLSPSDLTRAGRGRGEGQPQRQTSAQFRPSP